MTLFRQSHRVVTFSFVLGLAAAQSSQQQPGGSGASPTTAATTAPSQPASPGGVRLNVPPQMPAAWPNVDESKMIDGAFLQDPLVTQAMEYVKSVVPAQVLAIPPSTYKSGSTTTYNADPAANCYWPNNLCTRDTDSAYYYADVSKCPEANTWGITYDDGPISNNGVDDTADLLNNLQAANITATFFCVGSNVVQYPADVKRAYQAGHEISGHTWTHHPLTSLTNEQVVAEIKYTEAMIYNATGVVPAMMRPPYGDVDDRVRAIIWALGYRNILWTTNPDRDTGDADGATSAAEGAKILSTAQSQYFQAQPGFISLEHDISTFTTGVAISILKAITAARQAGSFPLNVIPVGKCGNYKVYQNAQPITTTTTTTTTATAAPTPVTGGSTPNVPDAKGQSNAASGTAPWGGVVVAGIAVYLVNKLL